MWKPIVSHVCVPLHELHMDSTSHFDLQAIWVVSNGDGPPKAFLWNVLETNLKRVPSKKVRHPRTNKQGPQDELATRKGSML